MIIENAKVKVPAVIQSQNMKKNSVMDTMGTSWGTTMIRTILFP